MSYEFVIGGKPITKARPRFSRVGKFVKTFDCQKKESREIIWKIKQQMPEELVLEPLDCPLSIEMRFYTPIPASWSKKKQGKFNGTPDTRHHDVDNFLKKYLDDMNGLVYRDDCLVVKLYGEKTYSANPRTVISVSKIEVICEDENNG